MKQDHFGNLKSTRMLATKYNGVAAKKEMVVISYEEYMENAGTAENK